MVAFLLTCIEIVDAFSRDDSIGLTFIQRTVTSPIAFFPSLEREKGENVVKEEEYG